MIFCCKVKLTGIRHGLVQQKRNVMAHAQKPDLVFQRNGRVHLYRRECQFSRLLAAEVCASAVVMLDRPCPIQCTTAVYPLHSPFSPSFLHPCVSVCHRIPFLLYNTNCWSGLQTFYKSSEKGSLVNHHRHHHHLHLANMELGRMLTRSGLTRSEVSSMVSPGFFCL